jgi:hypothetical protein
VVLEGESLVEIYYRTFLANQGEGSQLVEFSPATPSKLVFVSL